MAKKYQVFISSTYTDLIDERKAVEETIIRAGDIPVGMEAFPAADDEQFEFIKSVIDQCDYYLLIIAGRYGSLAPDGLSYTEKEFHYAVDRGIPVLFMLHGNRGGLAQEKSEQDRNGRELLEAFVEKASTGRIRKSWTSTDGLKLAVREALDHAKVTKLRPGWVRGDQVSTAGDLKKVLALQEENTRLRQELDEVKPPIGLPNNLAGLDNAITLTGSFRVRRERSSTYGGTRTTYFSQSFSYDTTFGEVFALLSPKLLRAVSDTNVNEIVAQTLCENRDGKSEARSSYNVDDEIFETIKVQMMALGVVSVKASRSTKGNVLLFWRLTEVGEQEMFMRRAKTVS